MTVPMTAMGNIQQATPHNKAPLVFLSMILSSILLQYYQIAPNRNKFYNNSAISCKHPLFP